jgi:aarF domain-containing kinase
MAESLPVECNFVNEAQNSERARSNLRCDDRNDVDIPRIHWPLTSKRVLTMQRMDGCIVSDVAALERMGIDKKEVSSLLSAVFSEMIFMHGFVHCDPHAGNVLVQRRSARDARPRLILLDHGLYRALDDPFRLSYARLWQSLIRGDSEGIKQSATEMNAGEMYPLFASMLTRKSYVATTLAARAHGTYGTRQATSRLWQVACWLMRSDSARFVSCCCRIVQIQRYYQAALLR